MESRRLIYSFILDLLYGSNVAHANVLSPKAVPWKNYNFNPVNPVL